MQGYYENHRDDMANAQAWYKRDDRCTPHFHNSVELVYVLEGVLKATLDGEALLVPAGSLLLNSSYTVHSYETPESCYSVIVIIPAGVVPSVRQMMNRQSFAARVFPDDAAGTFRTLFRMMADHGDKNPLALKGLCYAALGLLIERVGLAEARQSGRAAFLRDVLDYLQQRHTEPLSVQKVADHFGYSRSRFSRIFNEHLGYPLVEYVNSLRCRHAAQLLREGDLPVTEIAMAVGFDSLRTFYRAFQKQYKLTPNRFRKGEQA